MLRILFTSFTLLSVLIWGSFAQGWRLFGIPSEEMDLWESVLVYQPAIGLWQTNKEIEDIASEVFTLDLCYYFRSHKARQFSYWQKGLLYYNLFYDARRGRYFYVERLFSSGPVASRIVFLDQQLRLTQETQYSYTGHGSFDFVEIEIEVKQKVAGEHKKVLRYAAINPDKEDKDNLLYGLFLSGTDREQLEIISKKPEQILLLKDSRLYEIAPRADGLIEVKADLMRYMHESTDIFSTDN